MGPNKLEKIVIIDFGSQFTQLVARKIRELGAYSEIINPKNIKNNATPLRKEVPQSNRIPKNSRTLESLPIEPFPIFHSPDDTIRVPKFKEIKPVSNILHPPKHQHRKP